MTFLLQYILRIVTIQVMNLPGIKTFNWLRDNAEIKFSIRTGFSVEGRPIQEPHVYDVLVMRNWDGSKKHMPDNVLKACFEFWAREERERQRIEFNEGLRYVAGSVPALDELLEAVLEEPTETHKAVFLQMMWLIKRHIFGLPVIHDMMVVFLGRQGAGKSMFLHKFFEPLRPFVAKVSDMGVFDDDRIGPPILANNYVVFIDEMAKGDKVDMGRLKNFITTTEVSYRPLYTNALMQMPRRSTLVGASNVSLSELIYDNTGARRFFELRTKAQLDWDKVNNTDYLALWRSIDEQQSCPIVPSLEDVKAIQDRDLRYHDPIELFVREIALQNSDTERVQMADLYQEYEDFCRTYGYQKASAQKVSKRLMSLGFDAYLANGRRYFRVARQPKMQIISNNP